MSKGSRGKAFEDAARKEEIQTAADTIKNLRWGSKTEREGAKRYENGEMPLDSTRFISS